MSGKIKVKVKLGNSRDKKYVGPSKTNEDGYPFWYIEVIGAEDIGKYGELIGEISSVKLTPSWNQLKDFIRDVKVHELRLDRTRERKNDAPKWQKTITDASKEAQTQLSDFEIPEIYNQPKLLK